MHSHTSLRGVAAPLFVLLAVCFLGLSSCAKDDARYVKDGTAYGVTEGVFRAKWWGYYERGVSFLEGGYYDEAAADFRDALTGRSEDAWRARTYGLHFTRYFPNRELGVALYRLGQLSEAERSLRASLEDVDTARAHYYLDLVRKAQLAQGELADNAPPTITAALDAPVSASRSVAVNVSAEDDLGIAAVRVNGERLHQRGSRQGLALDEGLTLDEGTHRIRVEAEDLAGKTGTAAVDVAVDLTGPSIGIMAPAPELVTDQAQVELRAIVTDVNGVAEVRLDGARLGVGDGENRVDVVAPLILEAGENAFVLTAVDEAGNETRSALYVYRGEEGRAAAALRRLDGARFASLGPLQVTLSAVDGDSLTIDPKFPKEDISYSKNELRVSGRVVSADPITMAAIRVENEAPGEYPLEAVQAPVVEFSKRVPIVRGDNVITVAAEDEGGRRSSASFRVRGEQVALDSPDSKMSLAVLAFGGAADETTSTRLRAQTESAVVETERFYVVDRLQLASVLQEQELSDALGDPARALTLGKIVPAQAFVVGEIIETGDELEVYTRVVDTETSRIVGKYDAFIENKDDRGEVGFGLDAVAEWLLETFPRVPGKIIRAEGNRLTTNLGEEDGVREGMYVLSVMELEPEIDPDTGEVLSEGEYVPVGKARITTVRQRTSIAETAEEGSGAESGMPAITM